MYDPFESEAEYNPLNRDALRLEQEPRCKYCGRFEGECVCDEDDCLGDLIEEAK